jgi:hypothetical protein
MAAAPLFAVLATRALDASRAARAAERRAPRAGGTAGAPGGSRSAPPARPPQARGLVRLRRHLVAILLAQHQHAARTGAPPAPGILGMELLRLGLANGRPPRRSR